MQTPETEGSYVHFPSPVKSYFLSVLAIICSAAPGSVLAWLIVGALGLTGIGQALATVALAMIFSVLIFAGLAALGSALGITKKGSAKPSVATPGIKSGEPKS